MSMTARLDYEELKEFVRDIIERFNNRRVRRSARRGEAIYFERGTLTLSLQRLKRISRRQRKFLLREFGK